MTTRLTNPVCVTLSEFAALPGAAVLLLGGGGADEVGATVVAALDGLDDSVVLAVAVSTVDVAVSIEVGIDVRLELAPARAVDSLATTGLAEADAADTAEEALASASEMIDDALPAAPVAWVDALLAAPATALDAAITSVDAELTASEAFDAALPAAEEASTPALFTALDALGTIGIMAGGLTSDAIEETADPAADLTDAADSETALALLSAAALVLAAA